MTRNNDSRSFIGNQSTSETTRREDILSVADLAALPERRMVVMMHGVRPMVVEAEPYWETDQGGDRGGVEAVVRGAGGCAAGARDATGSDGEAAVSEEVTEAPVPTIGGLEAQLIEVVDLVGQIADQDYDRAQRLEGLINGLQEQLDELRERVETGALAAQGGAGGRMGGFRRRRRAPSAAPLGGPCHAR
ncbi:hypothetical protein GCM10020000_35830 [Streptomyces olivoverticillatus]